MLTQVRFKVACHPQAAFDGARRAATTLQEFLERFLIHERVLCLAFYSAS
jgi:hypothetical protein